MWTYPYLLLNTDIKHSWLTKQRASENKKDKETLPATIKEAFSLATPPVAVLPPGPHPVAPALPAAPSAAPGLIQTQ